MKTLTTLFMTLILTSAVWAQDPTPLETISSRIVEMQTMADNMIKDININAQGSELKFDDYHLAKKDLNTRIEKALVQYQKGLEEIKADLEKNLATYESELQSYKAAYEANGGKALEKAVDDRAKRFSDLVKTLEARLTTSYQKVLINLLTLNSSFVFPGERDFHAFNLIYLGLGISVGGALVPAFAPASGVTAALFIFGMFGCVVSPIAIVDDLTLHRWWSGRSIHRDNIGNRYTYLHKGTSVNGGRRKNFKETLEESSSELFGKCKTAGCVYLLAEDLKDTWINLKELNRNLKLWEGFKLKKVGGTISNRLAKKRIDQVAKITARKKNK